MSKEIPVKTIRLMAVFLAILLFAAGCGSDDDTTSTASDSTSTSTESDSESTSTEAAEPEAEPEVAEAGSIRLWLNGGDTPDEVVEFAVAEFNKIHPDVEVVFERQQWSGLVERLTTALSSSDTPDIVELGNTQAQAFEAAGALENLTADRDSLGGDDLLQSLLEAGTYNGDYYGVPYYAGARIIVYRTDLFEAASIDVPTTIDEMIEAAEKLTANSDTPNFSGFYLPGRNWYAALSFVWEEGGNIATSDGDTWTGELSSPASIAGLERFAEVFDRANAAPADSDDAADYIAFCNGEVGMMPAPGWKPGQILNPDDGCPELEGNIGVFAMPGNNPGTTAPVFLGGSVLGIAANSENKELAQDLLEIMIGIDYQSRIAETGLLPARVSLLDQVGGSDAAVAQALAAANSRFVPSSENWAAVEAAFVLQDMLTKIAQGDDVADAAESADAAIEEILNG